jgi:hypothetical protein
MIVRAHAIAARSTVFVLATWQMNASRPRKTSSPSHLGNTGVKRYPANEAHQADFHLSFFKWQHVLAEEDFRTC